MNRCTCAVLSSVVMVATAASSASAGGFDLGWNDCVGAGGVPNKSFACNSNTGSFVLVASFDPPTAIPTLVGGSAVIDLQFATSFVPAWWQLGVGGCRLGALHLDLNAASQACPNAGGGATMGSVSYLTDFGTPGRARIKVSWGMHEALATRVEPGNEYLAFSLVLDKSSSLGPGSCVDCEVPACLVLNALWLYQPAGLGDYPICNPLQSNYATWQGGAIGGLGCPPVDAPPPPTDCLTVPVWRRSWGQIKSVYR